VVGPLLQVASYSGFDRIDVGVYIVTTRAFQTDICCRLDSRMAQSVDLRPPT